MKKIKLKMFAIVNSETKELITEAASFGDNNTDEVPIISASQSDLNDYVGEASMQSEWAVVPIEITL